MKEAWCSGVDCWILLYWRHSQDHSVLIPTYHSYLLEIASGWNLMEEETKPSFICLTLSVYLNVNEFPRALHHRMVEADNGDIRSSADAQTIRSPGCTRCDACVRAHPNGASFTSHLTVSNQISLLAIKAPTNISMSETLSVLLLYEWSRKFRDSL